MKKVEQYIKEHTNRYSNHVELAPYITGFTKWLTIDDARKAVEIAKEEMIEKVVKHIIYNTRTVHYNNYDTREFNKSSLNDIIDDLKQAMKDE